MADSIELHRKRLAWLVYVKDRKLLWRRVPGMGQKMHEFYNNSRRKRIAEFEDLYPDFAETFIEIYGNRVDA